MTLLQRYKSPSREIYFYHMRPMSRINSCFLTRQSQGLISSCILVCAYFIHFQIRQRQILTKMNYIAYYEDYNLFLEVSRVNIISSVVAVSSKINTYIFAASLHAKQIFFYFIHAHHQIHSKCIYLS